MEKITPRNEGPSVFSHAGAGAHHSQGGVRLRDWAAVKFAAALCTMPENFTPGMTPKGTAAAIADFSYMLADAMLDRRQRTSP